MSTPHVDLTQPVTVKTTKAVLLSRIFTAIAVTAVAIAGSLTVMAVTGDRDGWKTVAEEATTENELLKTALFCRGDAAANESAALGELTIEIGGTAEAALRIASNIEPQESIIDLADRLQTAAATLRAATDEREATNKRCALEFTQEQENP